MSNLEKYLKDGIIFLFFLCVYSCTFLFKSWIFPYITSKTISFRICVELMFFLYTVLAVYFPQYRPRKSIILYSLLIFTVVLIVTSIFGINPQLSFAGDLERMWGINTWLHIAALFMVLSSVIKRKKEVNIIFYTLLVYSSYMAIYGYMQRIGIKGLFQTNITDGFQSFLGNSAYSAGVFMIGSLLSLFIFFKSKNIYSKIFACLCFALQLPALVISSIRGAQLGFIVAIFLILIFLLFKSESKKLKITLLISVLLLLSFLTFIFLNKNSDFVKNTKSLNKFSTMFDLGQGTVRTRLISWQGGIKSFASSPIIGLGMENYYYSFDKYFQADYYNIAATETWFDRAHNMFIETLACNGIFGILSYLFFIFCIFFALFKIYKSDKENNSLFFIFFLSIVVAYFIQNTFVFDSLGVVVMFFPILAIIDVYYTVHKEKDVLFEKELSGLVRNIIIGIVAVIVLYLIFFINVTHINVSRMNNLVQRDIAFKNFSMLNKDIEKLYSYNSFLNRDSTTMITDAVTGSIRNTTNQKDLEVIYEATKLMIEKTKYYLSINSEDTYFQINLSRLYMLLSNFYSQGSKESLEILNLAKNTVDKCIELSPERLHCYYFMGQIEASLGNKDASIANFQKAVDLNPKYKMSSFYLGRVYKSFGDIQKGDEILKRVYETNPELKEQE